MVEHNSIVSIEGFPLANFPAIKHLNLSDNFLREIRWLRKTLTHQLINLRSINLSNNEIADLRCLAECSFHQLEHLNLRNNKYPSFIDIEKIQMGRNQGTIKGRICSSSYEILVSSRGKFTSYTVGYRSLSRHKHSVRIEAL